MFASARIEESISRRSGRFAWVHIAISVVAVIRIALMAFPSHGYDAWAYRHWTWRLVHEPLTSFYVDDGQVFPDHLPGDIWLLKLMGEFANFLVPHVNFYSDGYTIAIAALATSFDAVLAFSLWRIGVTIGRGTQGKCVALAYWCTPATIFVASVWGQIDGISAALAIAALGLALNQRFSLAFVVLTLCVVVKPQYAMLSLPLMVGWWHNDRPNIRAWSKKVIGTAVSCLAMVAVLAAPFGMSLMGEWGRWSVLDRMKAAADRYHASALGAHNFWGWFDPLRWAPDDRTVWILGLSRQGIGLIAFAIIAILVGWSLIFRWRGGISMVLASNVLMFGFFLVTTRMHERYLFPVVALSLLLAMMDSRFWRYAISVGALVFLNIATRYFWWEYEGLSGWRSFFGLGWLEHEWAVRLMVIVSFGLFGWLVAQMVREPSTVKAAAPIKSPEVILASAD